MYTQFWKVEHSHNGFYWFEYRAEGLVIRDVRCPGSSLSPCLLLSRRSLWISECRKLWLLILECWLCCFWTAGLALLVADPLSVSKLLQILGASCEVSWMVTTAVNTFWRGTDGFRTVFWRILLVTFNALWRFVALGGRMSKRLAIETLPYRSGALKFLPSNYTVT
jgi:hypothetical protein